METKIEGDTFEDLMYKNPLPLFVDFWAEWCGSCRTLAPSIEKLKTEMKDNLTVIKINVDERPDLAEKYGIQSIPTMILFNKGTIVTKLIGAYPYSRLKSEIEKNLGE